MINRYKIHRIVENIKQSKFCFDVDEVLENLSQVLSFFHVGSVDLTDDEYYVLVDELVPMAEYFEFSEAAYIASLQDEVLDCIKGRKFSIRHEELCRKLMRADSAIEDSDYLQSLVIEKLHA